MLRARHADEVKDTVAVEIILGDTVRIGTDDIVMSTARAGVLNHGASKVKVVATKIDVSLDAICTALTDQASRLYQMTSWHNALAASMMKSGDFWTKPMRILPLQMKMVTTPESVRLVVTSSISNAFASLR
jgi:hypothetical protein